ncbi:MAG: serine--tRNA ligase [Elusimicrobia bacterium RIFOXYB2_FULL_50_12]|nr:MAG: serine--tRNA ligase [Elusimicrobia bacterium RIFOXYB2_FULL_50_12]
MLDIKLIREHSAQVAEALKKRNQNIPLDEVIGWDSERRTLISDMEELQGRRNKAAEEVGKLKRQGSNPPEALVQEMNNVREQVKEKERFLVVLEQKIEDFLLRIPNIPDESVPAGAGEKQNVVVRLHGEPQKYDFTPKPHWELGEKTGILDFSTAAKISGARFALLRGAGAKLERALISFMLETHTSRGYAEVLAPYLVNRASMQGTGQLPKFEEELFKCSEDQLYLIPTAEVSVTNIHRDEIIEEKDLPEKYVSYSACFRREAGSYGKDTRGLIRNHQFNKIELVKVVAPETSAHEHEELTADAEEILKQLGLPYRVIELCSGDLGFSSAKTYDLEVWMPGENRWREISSCSNFKDFQARRMNIKLRRQDKRKEFAHTINGSGIAVGRAFAALLENCQQKDGSIVIPEVLRQYTKFDRIPAR